MSDQSRLSNNDLTEQAASALSSRKHLREIVSSTGWDTDRGFVEELISEVMAGAGYTSDDSDVFDEILSELEHRFRPVYSQAQVDALVKKAKEGETDYTPVYNRLQSAMLWVDDQPGEPLHDRLGKAFLHYECRYHRKPDVCYANPLLLVDEGWGIVKIHGVEIVRSAIVLPTLFWMGQTGQA